MARKKQHHAEHPDERWLLTYADMITLLMALFMVLYAMSMVNKTKFEALRTTLKQSFSGAILTGGTSILDHGAVSSSQTQAQSDLTGKDTPVPDAFAPAPVAQQTAAERRQAERDRGASGPAEAGAQLDAAKAKVEPRDPRGAPRGEGEDDPRSATRPRDPVDHRRRALRARQVRAATRGPIRCSPRSPTRSSRCRTPYTSRATPTRCRARASSGNEGLSFAPCGHGAAVPRQRTGSRSAIATMPFPSPTGSGTRCRPTARPREIPRNRRVEIVILRNQFGTGTAAAGPLGDPIGTGADQRPSTP